MINSKTLEEFVSDQSGEPKFEFAGNAIIENHLLSEEEKNDGRIRNLQMALGISKDELATMIDGEHFNHQY